MNINKIVLITRLITAIILITSSHLFAKSDSGRNLFLLGDSTASQGRGGTGVSTYGTDIFYLNPASIADSERMDFGIQYGSLDFGYNNPDFAAAIPTSYGVFGASFRAINIPSDPADLKTGYLLSIGGAKYFTERLTMGSSINLFYGSDPANKFSYIGISIGSVYKINYNEKLKRGFGIFKPQIGLNINAGLPMGNNSKLANFNQLTLGYNFILYHHKDFYINFLNDFSTIHGYKDFPIKFGLESLIHDKYIIRAGCIAPQSYKYGDFTFGLGYRFNHEKFDCDINYSLIHYSGSDFVHYAGLNIKYGELDREPPLTRITANKKYISPNYDGKQDYVFFTQNVEDVSRIKGWKLQIINSMDEVVRGYRISERDIDEGFSIKNFINKIWQKKESMVVPETILWDGTDNKRKIVPDGKYTFSFISWDERDNISVAKTGIIYIDNTSPNVKTTTNFTLFSPNADKQKDTLKIDLDITCSTDDEWNGGFVNSEGMIIKSYEYKGYEISNNITWDGKDDRGNDAQEGLYSFFIESKDMAGNETKATIKGISLTRAYEVADITSPSDYFSYKNNKNIKFFLTLSKLEGIQEWKITIENEDAKIIKEITGGRDLPKFIEWDGKDSEKTRLKDGKYYFTLSTLFDSGNTPTSFKKELIIDSTPPEVSVSYLPDLFSPDEDGENDILSIFPESKDEYGIKEWEINIYSPAGTQFKKFKGKSNPTGEIKWDGIGENKMLVESAADYFLELSSTDLAGNSSKTKQQKIPIDVLVVVTERGLKIMISNIEFAFDSAKLIGRAFPILDRVTEILKKYRNYFILIEGNTCDIGEEEYNLELSESRAQSVMEYLISEGLNSNRLSCRGLGETSPFLLNTNPENRRRNRRVEFILIKKGKKGLEEAN